MYEDQSIPDSPPPTPDSTLPDTGSPSPAATEPAEPAAGQQTSEMLGQLPKEMASLLILAGIAGVILPGPVGTPMLIAGCVMMWPKTFRPLEMWFSRRFPRFHQEGVLQIKEFVSDLKARFPDHE